MSPALADLPVREVARALEAAGFERARVKGSHAVYRRTADGKVVVVPEHGTVKRGTLASIRPEGQRFQRPAWTLVSVMAGVFATASLRNSAARTKISPMVWPASWAW